MKKLKDFIMLVKTELLICVMVPVLTAVFLNTGVMRNQNYFPIIALGLLCIFTYGIVKMFFKINNEKKNSAQNESNESDINKPTSKSIRYRIFIVIAAIIMPVAGLTLNNNYFTGGSGGIFGDFTNIWFYIIPILNGLIMLADIKDNQLSLILLYCKITGFIYITYFTLIFIPIIPYGFIGLIFYGLGILVFVPAAVFVTELSQILKDINILKVKFKKNIIAVIILGIITIPAVMTVSFLTEKINFSKALIYLSADSWETPVVNIAGLDKTLQNMDNALLTRSENRDFFNNGTNIPVISKIYQTIVFNDKILSPDTTLKLRRIFWGTADNQPINNDTERTLSVNLINAAATSEFDETAGIYKTWVDLEIRNDSGNSLSEYATEFLLPDGCFIKDYYLDVGYERKQGILADKRAALITYNNILQTPKDPGIIYYKSDNVIELRVYPFGLNETRKTGFLIWHSQNEIITIDGREIYLTAENSIKTPIDMQGVSFIPASYKKDLPVRERDAKYYFIIDASTGSPYNEHLKKAADYMDIHGITEAKVYAASYKLYDAYKKGVKCEGGFNLSFAIEMIFKECEENDDSVFPVIIAVSDNINKAAEFQKSNMAKRFSESEYYYNLGYDLSLTPYSFSDNKKHDIIKSPVLSKTLDYNSFAVADNGKSEIVLTGDFGNYTDNEYQNAFILYGKSSAYDNDNSTQIELIRDSFRQRVLTKYTSFTVLETQAQENALLELQAKFLNDEMTDAPAVMMNEPGLLVCLIMFFAFVLFVYYRRFFCEILHFGKD